MKINARLFPLQYCLEMLKSGKNLALSWLLHGSSQTILHLIQTWETSVCFRASESTLSIFTEDRLSIYWPYQHETIIKRLGSKRSPTKNQPHIIVQEKEEEEGGRLTKLPNKSKRRNRRNCLCAYFPLLDLNDL